MWFLNSLERNAAKFCHSSMPTQRMICLNQCLALSKKWMKYVVSFSCYKYLCRPDLRPHQPYHQFPEYGMSGTPDCADVGPKLWLNPCQWTQKMAFRPWPEVFGLNTTNTACFVPTCKRGFMVAAFTKMLSFLVPLYEARNGMAGPRHGYLAWLSYLTLAGLLFAVALGMYSCVQGKLHVAPCWDLTKHLLQMWMWLHKQWYRQMTFTKTSELSRLYHAAQ